MAKTVKPGDLGKAIARELGVYSTDVTKKLNTASKEAAQELVELTRASAPFRTGGFAAHIDMKLQETRRGCATYVWYVKPPHHRVTHLLVHGHATRNGGRAPGHPFLHNAWATVKAKYEKALREVFR